VSYLHLRIRVAQFSDGWNIVVECNGKPSVYDPTYATEAEAEAQARRLSATLRAMDSHER
jgi:hypothetical protein